VTLNLLAMEGKQQKTALAFPIRSSLFVASPAISTSHLVPSVRFLVCRRICRINLSFAGESPLSSTSYSLDFIVNGGFVSNKPSPNAMGLRESSNVDKANLKGTKVRVRCCSRDLVRIKPQIPYRALYV
jgi:hypothetical protein